MTHKNDISISAITGNIPYRMAFAGGWIDQPFISKLNPDSVGSMVVAAIEADCRFMDRCGMGTSTRNAARELWPAGLPKEDPAAMTRLLYDKENADQPDPSGSQDMIGLIYPGISRLDYDYNHQSGVFPVNIETCTSQDVGRWLEKSIYMVPVSQRPAGYNPLETKNLDSSWIKKLGQTGRECYDAITAQDLKALGKSMNDCMECWRTILPNTVSHSTITIDLMGILEYYQQKYAGAMYSGCGGGYLYVVSNETVPGGFQVRMRME